MKRDVRIVVIAAMAASMSIPAIAQSAGASTYKSKCAMCHGADGLGNTPAGKALKTISFKSPELVKASNAELIADTKKGKGAMPEYGTKLSDEQIREVIEYIRTLQK